MESATQFCQGRVVVGDERKFCSVGWDGRGMRIRRGPGMGWDGNEDAPDGKRGYLLFDAYSTNFRAFRGKGKKDYVLHLNFNPYHLLSNPTHQPQSPIALLAAKQTSPSSTQTRSS